MRIGVDLGGTKIEAIALDAAGGELLRRRIATPRGDYEATIRAIVKAAPSIADLVNKRHEIAKTKGWAEKPPDAETFIKAVAKEPNLLRRPIYIAGKKIIIGFDKAAYAKLK